MTFSCAKCGQLFGVRSNLKRHQKTERACLPRGPKEEMARSEYLPEGWTFRERKKGLDIQTPEGVKLDSYVAISRYMLHKETYTKEQMDMMYLFPDGKNHKKGSMGADGKNHKKGSH